MKKVTLFFLISLFFFYANAQDYNYYSLGVKSIDSIVRVIKSKNLITYRETDSTLRKFYSVNKKSKELFAVEIINHYYARRKEMFSDYYRFIYYFYKEEIIKLYVIECANRKNCKKGTFYFSNGKVIHKEGLLTDNSYLKKPLEFSQDFKSFVRSKSNWVKSK